MSKKIFLSIVSLLLILSMLISCAKKPNNDGSIDNNDGSTENNVANNNESEEKILYTGKNSYNNIAGDKLVVSLFSRYDPLSYTADSFSEVNCEKLEVKTIANDTFLYLSIPLIDKSDELSDKNEENLISALRTIEKRDDVKAVFPKYKKIICTTPINADFSENELTITPFPEYNNYKYTVDDFKEINCISIKELLPPKHGELHRWISLEIPGNDKENVLAAIKKLEKREDIAFADPSFYFSYENYTSDPFCNDSDQWAISKINLSSAWNILSGGSTVTVGVIDGGIDNQHPDLAGRINVSLSKDFYENAETGDVLAPFADRNGHGTFVAGIINAQGNNGSGTAGVSWKNNVELVSLKVSKFKASENKYVMDGNSVILAINHASATGIDIINASYGLYPELQNTSAEYINRLRSAIDAYPGLFVCSAGNDNSNNDSYTHLPSDNCDLNNVISVGASQSDDDKWQKSNYGQETVSIFAPGALILSCYPTYLCGNDCSSTGHVGVGYHTMSGTSMATPFVTGVAALLLSANPNLTAENLKKIIMSCDDDVSALSELCVSGGRLNAYKAVTHVHTNRYEQISSFSQHKCICTVCDYEHLEDHDWRLKYVGASVSGDNEL
ncbi:MAG: S8 family serine peptidase, partial [Clostridia bacterium]|nr:S8 family serine peptidase [Clostridia bacterium]